MIYQFTLLADFVPHFLKECCSGNIKEMKNILSKIETSNQRLFVVNSKNSEGKSPLHISIINDNIDAVKFLIGEGAYVNTDLNTKKNRLDEFSPLSYACDHGNMEIIKLLLQEEAHADVHAASFAAEKGQLDACKLLLKKNPNVLNHKAFEGRTLLAIAARYGHKDIVQYLLEQQSLEINCKDDKGQTPLMLAVINNHISLVIILLERGADASIKDKDKSRAINYAKKEEIENMLKDHVHRT